MHFFGYAGHPDIKSATQFATYDDQTEAEIANHSEFLKLNKELLEKVGEENHSETWAVNGGEGLTSAQGMMSIFAGFDEEVEIKNP